MSLYEIPLCKPYHSKHELTYLKEVLDSGKISSSGKFSQLCESFFENYFNGSQCLLTHTCTDALEMVALLLDIQENDEIILPSYTFVSTANPFVMQGATLRFADSRADHPNVDVASIMSLVNEKTKAIVVVHYAGMAVDMEELKAICKAKGIILIEDAAQAFGSSYNGQKLGSIGDLACFSFHDTKQISCGEGGLLVINNPIFRKRAELLLEKGTNRLAFKKGMAISYDWQDVGSSFGASQLQAAVLYSQLQEMDIILERRKSIYELYENQLAELQLRGYIRIPKIFEFCSFKSTSFFIELPERKHRNLLMQYLNQQGIQAGFHYLCLHNSPFYRRIEFIDLPNAMYWQEHILRMPLYPDLNASQLGIITDSIKTYFINK